MSSPGSTSDSKNWSSDDLEGLPPTVNIYPWEGPDHFMNIVNSESQRYQDQDPESSDCGWIVFSNVSETVFEREFQEGDLSKEWKSYNHKTQLLFVEIA
jgi:hypothetical protein